MAFGMVHEIANRGYGVVPQYIDSKWFSGMDPVWFADNTYFDITTATTTNTALMVGGIPALVITATSATTDRWQAQYANGAAGAYNSLQLKAGKPVRLSGLFRTNAIGACEIQFGWSIIDTAVNAANTYSSEYFLVEKTAAATSLKVRTSKAAGTALTSECGGSALVSDNWYMIELILTRDATTAGKGKWEVWLAGTMTPGFQGDQIGQGTFLTQFPDTATTDLSPVAAITNGDTAANVHYFGGMGWAVPL